MHHIISREPLVLEYVVKNDLCIGCGACVNICPQGALEMHWDEYGFLKPKLIEKCESRGECITVCPFNPWPQENIKNEDEMAELFLTEASEFHRRIGKYCNLYAGYSKNYRLTSSSGGIATYLFSELLKKNIVDYIVCVNESSNTGMHYEYTIISNQEQIVSASKTRYFPVTMAAVLKKISEMKGRIAIVGVACFIKAIRLTQIKEPDLNRKILFLVGIICGGLKSRFFTEYLAGKSGVAIEKISKPQYRIKNPNSTAVDYSFGCYDQTSGKEKNIRMSDVGDMWGTGLFKNHACDFCDDITAELADISLGDAWLYPYIQNGKGTSIIVTRSSLADELIREGVNVGKLELDLLPIDRFLLSQKGGFNHRQKALSYRLKLARKRNYEIQQKRFENETIPLIFRIVQLLRSNTRRISLEIWKEKHEVDYFERKIKLNLVLLRIVTILYHGSRAIVKLLKRNDNGYH